MYEINDGSVIEARFVGRILALRAELVQAPIEELHGYLQRSATDTRTTALVLRQLVMQALNAKAAEARKAVQK